MSLHLKLLDIDHPLTFEESKLRQIEAHALIYLSGLIPQHFLFCFVFCYVNGTALSCDNTKTKANQSALRLISTDAFLATHFNAHKF